MMLRTILLLTLGAPAWAGCPVAADLDSGVRLLYENGTAELYRQQRPAVVAMTSTFSDGYESRAMLGQGVYLLEVVDLVAGEADPSSRVTYAFDMTPDAMPVPSPGAKWRARTIVDRMDQEKLTASWDDAAKMVFGECAYTVIAGTMHYAAADYSYTERLHFFPDLGFAYLASFDDHELEEPEVYRLVSMSVVAQ